MKERGICFYGGCYEKVTEVSKRTGKIHGYCEKHRIKQAEIAARESTREYRRKYKKVKSTEAREIVNRLVLFKGCAICGYKKCARALCFHHIDSKTKKATIARLLSYGMTKSLRHEIRKCMILCANCHMEFHAGEIELPKVN